MSVSWGGRWWVDGVGGGGWCGLGWYIEGGDGGRRFFFVLPINGGTRKGGRGREGERGVWCLDLTMNLFRQRTKCHSTAVRARSSRIMCITYPVPCTKSLLIYPQDCKGTFSRVYRYTHILWVTRVTYPVTELDYFDHTRVGTQVLPESIYPTRYIPGIYSWVPGYRT